MSAEQPPVGPDESSSLEGVEEDFATQYAKDRDKQLMRPFENRRKLLEAIPELATYYAEGRFEPPPTVEAQEADADPELNEVLGKVAGTLLDDNGLVELRHPRHGIGLQISTEDGHLMISETEPKERTVDGITKLTRVRYLERDRKFIHRDIVISVEQNPEFAEPPRYENSTVTRMEGNSVLTLLIESDVVRREK